MSDPNAAPETKAEITSSSPEIVEKVQTSLDAFNASVDETPAAVVEESPAGELPAEGEKAAEEPVAEATPAAEGEEKPAETPAQPAPTQQ